MHNKIATKFTQALFLEEIINRRHIRILLLLCFSDKALIVGITQL